MIRALAISVAVAASLHLTGCAAVISATHDGPIANEPSGRSFGRYIDDESIETVILVNIDQSSEALANSNVSVVSYNGVVLLVGQVQSAAHRERLTEIARDVRGVRQVHNQVSVGGAISNIATLNDSYITSKVRSHFLASSADVDFSNIKVVTENSVVYLMGVISHTDAEAAVNIARQVGGVQRIVKVFEYN